MTTIVRMNLDKSRELYLKHRFYIEKQMCYNNVFSVINQDYELMSKINNGEWAIAYGFFQFRPNSNMFIRHAFLLDENNDAIDVTQFEVGEFDQDIEYHVIREICFIEEYQDFIAKNDYNPSLNFVFMKDFIEYEKLMLQQENIFIG